MICSGATQEHRIRVSQNEQDDADRVPLPGIFKILC